MEGGKDRTQFATKLFVAILLMVLLTIYNGLYYSELSVLNSGRSEAQGLAQYRAPRPSRSHARRRLVIRPLPRGYLVWNENCRMPSMEPMAPHYEREYQRMLEKHYDVGPVCPGAGARLASTTYDADLQSYVLTLDGGLKRDLLNESSARDLSCCYRKITRMSDRDSELHECLQFGQSFVVPGEVEHMTVECSDIGNASSILYKDAFSFIQQRPHVQKKFANNQGAHRPFGILLFGIDTVSQFNFRRVMPKTLEYVQRNNWFELSGYNKIEDNTFPNLMAIFTGMDLTKAEEVCQFNTPGGLDNCTTLFNLFNRQGMATAYSEDACMMSTFNYLKPGFVNPPTDYYQRPLFLAIEKELPVKKLTGLEYCLGPRRYGEYVYDFGVEFAERFVGQSIFGLFWTNTFSHNDWIDPATMDGRMVEYFEYMDSKQILDNNVVVLFSDHGARWGFLRNQKEGYIEERLPMMFMHLPKWFQEAHPDIVSSLMVNKHRLTSPYDMHMTLKHLALISLGKYEGIELPPSCLTCQTLFEPVLENRTCQLAGIDDHWCTCTPFETLDRESSEMQNLTELVILKMNQYLNATIYGDVCAPLMFKRNVEANLKLDLHSDIHESAIKTYRMNFEVTPNDAAFDATFVYDSTKRDITLDVPMISRLNSYAADSACIGDHIVQKYCICKDSIKSS